MSRSPCSSPSSQWPRGLQGYAVISTQQHHNRSQTTQLSVCDAHSWLRIEACESEVLGQQLGGAVEAVAAVIEHLEVMMIGGSQIGWTVGGLKPSKAHTSQDTENVGGFMVAACALGN